MINEINSSCKGVSPLLGISAISSHSQEVVDYLKLLNYPETSLASMIKCGSPSGQTLLLRCDCSTKLVPLTHHCNLRTCPTCSQIRRKRVFRDYMPILSQYSTNPRSREFLYFLTISPANYDSLEEGLKHIRKSFSKFIRNKYVKERIVGGLYVIESKNTGKGWHVHLHCIINGRWLDNRIRGYCPCCKQNLIKKDHFSMKYYCANRKCNNTENLVINEDSKVVSIWKKCSNRDVNFNIQRQSSSRFTLNYMLKYISVNKDDFVSHQQVAQYIVATRKQKLISKFGNFFRVKIVKQVCMCKRCGGEVECIYDMEIVHVYLDSLKPQNDPPNSIFSF